MERLIELGLDSAEMGFTVQTSGLRTQKSCPDHEGKGGEREGREASLDLDFDCALRFLHMLQRSIDV